MWKSCACYDIISWAGSWCMSRQQLSSRTVTLSKLTTHFTLHTYSKSYVWNLDMTGQGRVWIKYTLPSTPYCTTDVASKSPGFHPSTPCDSWLDVLRQDTSHRRPHEICTVFLSDCIYCDILQYRFMWCRYFYLNPIQIQYHLFHSQLIRFNIVSYQSWWPCP